MGQAQDIQNKHDSLVIEFNDEITADDDHVEQQEEEEENFQHSDEYDDNIETHENIESSSSPINVPDDSLAPEESNREEPPVDELIEETEIINNIDDASDNPSLAVSEEELTAKKQEALVNIYFYF